LSIKHINKKGKLNYRDEPIQKIGERFV